MLVWLNGRFVDARRARVSALDRGLLHGDGDTVIPTAESSLLADALRGRGADVHLLLSGVITHAEANRAAALTDMLELVAFWASVLRQ